MTEALMKKLSDTISHEAKLSNIELEAMSKTHKMALNGFKRFFKYRAKDRFKHYLCLKQWGIDYAETNLPFEVEYNSGNSLLTLEMILKIIFDESEKQLVHLKECMDLCFKETEVTLGNKINMLIDDQEEEHKYLKRIIDEWNMAKSYNDVSWISRKDHLLHKKYKKAV